MATRNASARGTRVAQPATAPPEGPLVNNAEPSLRTSSRVRTLDSRVAALLPSFKHASDLGVQKAPPGPVRATRMGGRAGSSKELEEDDYEPSSSERDESSDQEEDEEAEALLEQRRGSNAEASTNPGQR